MPAEFWSYLERLIQEHSIIIDRPKGSAHPEFSDAIYPLDYGYLKGMKSSDDAGIDVWIGESGEKKLTAIVNSVDLYKNDIEMKLLLDCTEADFERILQFHNSGSMRGILIRKSTGEVLHEVG